MYQKELGVAASSQQIAYIIARVRARRLRTHYDLQTMERELRAKWEGKRGYVPKIVHDALTRACRIDAEAL